MSKKVVDTFQPKITRNDRFAQMSHQEKVIEQKKKEIQLKLEAKQKAAPTTEAKTSNASASKPAKSNSAPGKVQDTKKSAGFNLFSNDGSFLDQYKQLKDKRFESKLKSFKNKDNLDKTHSEDKNKSRWVPRRRSSSPKERTPKIRVSRFSDKPAFEQKITINTSFNNAVIPVMSCNVTGQPLLKNLHFHDNETVIAASPVLLNVPPPQIVPSQISVTTQNILVTSTSTGVLGTVTLPPPILGNPVPPPGIPSVELSSIPPPNPIQVQNIPPPEPINAINIPPPAPIQVQNIPTPTSIQLNEIPNPKPLDLLAIPTPNEDNKSISDTEFLKNIPPPNKSVPPPSLPEVQSQVSLVQLSTNLLPPPPMTQNITVQTLPPPQPTQNVLVPAQIQTISLQQSTQVNNSFTSVTVALPVGVVPPSVNVPVVSAIPSLMAQPILPPPGMVGGVNVNCPPPLLTIHANAGNLQPPPPSFIRQPPPQMPPMNVPPPNTTLGILNAAGTFKDLNAVFPPGTPDFEAMSSLARMVAQCGSSIEEVVRLRKNQDPSHWFLFHKDSAAYQQYLQLVEQFKSEELERSGGFKSEEIYEPENTTDDIDFNLMDCASRTDFSEKPEGSETGKRKRRSRWDKDNNAPSPVFTGFNQQISNGPTMLSKVQRTDQALVQYAINTFGSSNLTDEEWKKAEDHYKINLLYQDMVKKREEVEKLKVLGMNKYDYDSDEEVDGGTWEHRLREKEMMATQLWAQELTRQAEGKHHIGDFLPPDELKRFLEKSTAAREGRQPNFSDYKEFKIKEDNIGFKMLQKLGWSEGQGLGSSGSGIVEPVNKAAVRDHNQGLGMNQSDNENDEDEYESYRKRMMLAYRFRPNPLNNPRRPYY